MTGYTHYRCGPGDADRIWKSTMALAHRGPDHQDVYRSDHVSLGAVRLRIIDLAGGDQPMRSNDGDTVIVFNGELFNNPELRTELRARGIIFSSQCDTETVMHAFRVWDLDCLPKLRGMFAFAVWSESRKRLVLARDRMGIKPLYYAPRGENLYFGSELKAILAHPEVTRTLDAEGLHYFTSLNYVPAPFTLIDGIRKVLPGTWMEWQAGRVRSGTYWKLDFQPDARLEPEDASAQLDSLLSSAVKEQLVSDVPVGIWVSGGLDSTSVLHYAAQHSTQRIKTFSVSFRGRKFDDGDYARKVARHYGTDHHEFDLSPAADLASAIDDLSFYSDEPGADAGALPVWFLSKLTKQHVTVALSGEGADELFGGYTTYLADRYARPLRLVPLLARKLALNLAHRLPVSDEKIGMDYKIQRMLAGSLLPASDAHLYWNGTFSEKEKKKLHLRNGHPPVGTLMEQLPAHSLRAGHLNRYLWLDQTFYLPDDILYKCDRMSMAHAVEVRPPFLDPRVVDFASRLPENLKIRGGQLKYILRRTMAPKLPAGITHRKKEGFDIPAHEWFRGPLKTLLLDTVTRDAVVESNLFHWSAVESVIQNHLERRANLGYHLWGLLTLFLWMKRWRI
ncbi:MAG: asparagine synthase (glutamine-hydrolyzing), partial [Acidobacteriaceae bacterium]|nr:asparagine synthase (glutamine-hydrolyzing) [Acidobacteriaceae bacterium]